MSGSVEGVPSDGYPYSDRLEEVSGLAALDDHLDEVRITQIIARFGARFGV